MKYLLALTYRTDIICSTFWFLLVKKTFCVVQLKSLPWSQTICFENFEKRFLFLFSRGMRSITWF